MPFQIKEDGSPVKIFVFSDLGVASGFGRIANHTTRTLAMRGWNICGASLLWGGYPFQTGLPFPVTPMGGKDPNTMWTTIAGMIQTERPDVVIVCQDFPYAISTFHNLRLDWSAMKFINITPIDGTPIHPQWLELTDLVDGTLVISRFGVEAMRLAGRQVDLLHPGVDTNEFYPAESQDEITALRARLAIPADAFVTGSFMMNQGRKMVSQTIAQFLEFAKDKPDAWLFMDMDKASPAGFDILSLLTQMDANPAIVKRIRFREDALNVGILGLRERYILCDVTSQLAHREGFGLPNLESMACRVPPMVMDWCSGSELAADGKAALIRRLSYMEHGTWGGARDAFPDLADWLVKWNGLYRDKDMRFEYAGKGYKWAIEQTWDRATDQLEAVLKRVVEQQKKERSNESKPVQPVTPALSDDGNTRGGPAIAPAALPDPIDHRADLQQLTESHQVPEPPRGDGGPDTDGDTLPGRRKPRVRSKGIDRAAV